MARIPEMLHNCLPVNAPKNFTKFLPVYYETKSACTNRSSKTSTCETFRLRSSKQRSPKYQSNLERTALCWILGGLSIIQAISYSFLQRRPGFNPRWCQMGFVLHKGGTEASFLRALWFLLQIFIPPTLPYSSLIRSGTTGQLVADVRSGLSGISLHEKIELLFAYPLLEICVWNHSDLHLRAKSWRKEMARGDITQIWLNHLRSQIWPWVWSIANCLWLISH
jgi:hypothetical protein